MKINFTEIAQWENIMMINNKINCNEQGQIDFIWGFCCLYFKIYPSIKGVISVPTLILHVLVWAHLRLMNTGFRDYRSNETNQNKYAQVKRNLAKNKWRRVQHYADAKTSIVQEIITANVICMIDICIRPDKIDLTLL